MLPAPPLLPLWLALAAPLAATSAAAATAASSSRAPGGAGGALPMVAAPTPASVAAAALEVPASAAPSAYRDRVAGALASEPGGLTSDEVARRAVIASPEIEARRAALQQTASSVDNTIARFVPNVTLTAQYTRLSPADIAFGSGASVGAANEGLLTVGPCPTGAGQCVLDSAGQPVGAASFGAIAVPLNNYSLQAALSVPFLDYALQLVPARVGAEAETRAASLRRDAEKVSVQAQAKLAYYDWLRAKAQVAVTEQSRERAAARLEDARIGLQAGTLTRTDVLRLESALASADAGVESSRSFERLAASNLAVIMGDTGTPAYRVGEDVLSPRPALPASADKAQLIDEAKSQRLEVQALRESSDALGEARKSSRRAFWPRLDGFAQVNYANPNQRFFPLESQWRSDWAVGLTASWNLSSFLASRSQDRSVEASERETAASLASVERAVTLEVESAWEERERARRSLAAAERSANASEAAYAQQVALYRGGEATTTDVLESEAERLSAALSEVNARIDLRVADTKLERATGRTRPLAVDADAGDARYETVGLTRPRTRTGAGTKPAPAPPTTGASATELGATELGATEPGATEPGATEPGTTAAEPLPPTDAAAPSEPEGPAGQGGRP